MDDLWKEANFSLHSHTHFIRMMSVSHVHNVILYFINFTSSTKIYAILCFPGEKSPQNECFKEQLSLAALDNK